MKMNPAINQLGVFTLAALLATVTCADDLQSVTEPRLDLMLAAGDMGVIVEVFVEPGDKVHKGQLLARIDDSVLQRSIASARAAMESTATLKTAEIEREIRKRQYDNYLSLYKTGDITQRELDRAEEAFKQSEVQVIGKFEQQELRELEYQRIQAQLVQRRLLSPIDGYVVEVKKQIGEFVSPTEPALVQVVDVSELQCWFSVPLDQCYSLQEGQRITLLIESLSQSIQGTITCIMPIVEAGSGTKQVKVAIDNHSEQIPSGVTCFWNLPTSETENTEPSDQTEQITRNSRSSKNQSRR